MLDFHMENTALLKIISMNNLNNYFINFGHSQQFFSSVFVYNITVIKCQLHHLYLEKYLKTPTFM